MDSTKTEEVAYGVIEMTTSHDRQYNNFQTKGNGAKEMDVTMQAEYECSQLL